MTNQTFPKPTGKFLPIFRKYGKYLIIALLLLGLGAGIWISTRPAFVPPEYPDAPLAAMKLKGSRFMTIPERYPYSIIYLEPGETLPIKTGFLPPADQMPVFQYTAYNKGWDPTITHNFLDRVMPKLVTVLDTKYPNYEVDPYFGYTHFNFSGYRADVDQSENSTGVTMYIEKSTEASKQQPIALNGIDVVANARWTDGRLLREIAWAKDELLKIFPMDVPDTTITRYEDRISVLYYNMASHYTNPYSETPLGSYIALGFTPSKEDSTTYHLSSVFVKEYLASPDEIYEQYAMANTISLREAKQYLKNGYVYGDHICEKCEDWDTFAPILDYDTVGITYAFDLGIPGYTVPFYVFCKQLECGGDYEKYMCVSVPAVELRNWAKYTESFHVSHDE